MEGLKRLHGVSSGILGRFGRGTISALTGESSRRRTAWPSPRSTRSSSKETLTPLPSWMIGMF